MPEIPMRRDFSLVHAPSAADALAAVTEVLGDRPYVELQIAPLDEA
jgi:hypothetical protein